jgi:chromosome segregation ATPase
MVAELLALPPLVQAIGGGLVLLVILGFGLWLVARAALRRQAEEAAAVEMRLRDQLVQARNQAQQTTEQLNRVSQTLVAERQAHGDLVAIGERRAAAEAQLAETSRTLALRRQELAEVEERLAGRKRELERLGQDQAEATRRKQAAEAELAEVQARLVETRASLERTRAELDATEQRLAEARAELARLEEQIADRRPIAQSVSAIEARLKAVAEQQLAQLKAASEALVAEAAAVEQQLRAIPEN